MKLLVLRRCTQPIFWDLSYETLTKIKTMYFDGTFLHFKVKVFYDCIERKNNVWIMSLLEYIMTFLKITPFKKKKWQEYFHDHQN